MHVYNTYLLPGIEYEAMNKTVPALKSWYVMTSAYVTNTHSFTSILFSPPTIDYT